MKLLGAQFEPADPENLAAKSLVIEQMQALKKISIYLFYDLGGAPPCQKITERCSKFFLYIYLLILAKKKYFFLHFCKKAKSPPISVTGQATVRSLWILLGVTIRDHMRNHQAKCDPAAAKNMVSRTLVVFQNITDQVLCCERTLAGEYFLPKYLF